MHLKVFVKLKKTLKTLKTLSSGQKNPENPKNPKKKQKKKKKPTGLGFFLKTRVFSNPALCSYINPVLRIRIRDPCLFLPLDPGSGSNPLSSESLVKNCWVKKILIRCQSTQTSTCKKLIIVKLQER